MLPRVEPTPVPGLRRIELDIRRDERGWFEESWQAEKFDSLGLGFFRPLQGNASSNLDRGVTRGFHAEPWSKLVTVLSGRVFSAWVDLREGPNWGKTHWSEIEPGVAYFVPKGVANSYQALEAKTTYSYLVDGIWKPGLTYPSIDLFDHELDIPWPIGQIDALTSPKDASNPPLFEARQKQITSWVVFGTGQVGKAMVQVHPGARQIGRSDLDFARATLEDLLDMIPVNSVVVNAAAYTAVDHCETPEGFERAMELNYQFPRMLALACRERSATLVHFSSDYVFDGQATQAYSEESTPSPRSRYGLSKLLGDLALRDCPHSYLIRTSWVFGSGKNFIETITSLARSRDRVTVVSDQIGRPTSASDLAAFTKHLVSTGQDFGTYNLTSEGSAISWFELARFAVSEMGMNPERIQPISTQAFGEGKKLATRPASGLLDLAKAKATGFMPTNWQLAVGQYLRELQSATP